MDSHTSPSRAYRRPKYPTLPSSNMEPFATTQSGVSPTSARSESTTSDLSSTSDELARAPMPSPILTQHDGFFGTISGHMEMGAQSNPSMSPYLLQRLRNIPQQRTTSQDGVLGGQQQQQMHSPFNPQQQALLKAHQQAVMMQREATGNMAKETSMFRDQEALVAEAAKRAQMAVLERDMESVGLGLENQSS